MKNIWVPRPGYDSEEDEHAVEQELYQETPSWHRHFEADELFGRYEPSHELGTFSIPNITQLHQADHI